MSKCASPEHEDSFPITAHAVTLNVLIYLVELAERGESALPLSGLHPGELAALRKMSVGDFSKLTDQGQPLLRVTVDPQQLRLCLARAKSRDDLETTKRWFVQRGTPHVLMQELYGTPIREFREMRSVIGMAARAPGRPRVLKAAHAHRVRIFWSQLGSQLSLVERYKRLGEAFPDDSMASLYGALHDHSH